MSEPDFRQMGDPLNDRLPPRRQWLQAGAPNHPLARDDYHPNERDKGQMIEAMWAEIDTLRSALRYLDEWCPSEPPRQAEINRLLAAPRLPMRSLLQLRTRFHATPDYGLIQSADDMSQEQIDAHNRVQRGETLR